MAERRKPIEILDSPLRTLDKPADPPTANGTGPHGGESPTPNAVELDSANGQPGARATSNGARAASASGDDPVGADANRSGATAAPAAAPQRSARPRAASRAAGRIAGELRTRGDATPTRTISARVPEPIVRDWEAMVSEIRASAGTGSQKELPSQEMLTALIWRYGNGRDPATVNAFERTLTEYRLAMREAEAERLRKQLDQPAA
jgi:hypothetical protein